MDPHAVELGLPAASGGCVAVRIALSTSSTTATGQLDRPSGEVLGTREHLVPYYSRTGCPSIDPLLIIGCSFSAKSSRRLTSEATAGDAGKPLARSWHF